MSNYKFKSLLLQKIDDTTTFFYFNSCKVAATAITETLFLQEVVKKKKSFLLVMCGTFFQLQTVVAQNLKLFGKMTLDRLNCCLTGSGEEDSCIIFGIVALVKPNYV